MPADSLAAPRSRRAGGAAGNIRICHLGLYYEHGGLAHHVQNLAVSTAAMADVTVTAMTPTVPELARAGVRVRQVRLVSGRMKTLQSSLICAGASLVRRLPACDVMHTHHPLSTTLMRITGPGRPLVQTVHHIPSLDSLTLPAPSLHSRLRAVSRMLEQVAWSCADALICVHAELAAWLHERCGVAREKVHVIPNGVDVERFRPDPAAAAAVRDRLRIGASEILVTCPKTLPKDDFESVVRAVASLDDPRIRLLLPSRDARARLSDLVTSTRLKGALVVDPVPYSRIGALYGASDIVVVPYLRKEYTLGDLVPRRGPAGSLEETCRMGLVSGSNLSVMEALASGAATVVTAPGVAPSCDPDDVGGIAPSWDHSGLAQVMGRLAADRGLARRLGRNGRRLVSEEFTWDRIAERTMEVYRSVLGR